MKATQCDEADFRRRTVRRTTLVVVLALAGTTAPVHGAGPIGISGYELFPGRIQNGVVKDVSFAGTTNTACERQELARCWNADSNGGNWIARIERTGGAGIGDTGQIVGGKLILEQTNGIIRLFKVQPTTIRWPKILEEDIGCGPGSAAFSAELGVLGTQLRATLDGCLDDTHLDPRKQPFVFPPRIWGTLTPSF